MNQASALVTNFCLIVIFITAVVVSSRSSSNRATRFIRMPTTPLRWGALKRALLIAWCCTTTRTVVTAAVSLQCSPPRCRLIVVLHRPCRQRSIMVTVVTKNFRYCPPSTMSRQHTTLDGSVRGTKSPFAQMAARVGARVFFALINLK